MNVDNGRIYETREAALADLDEGQTAESVVEVFGERSAIERLSKSIQLAKETEARRAKNKQARASRRANR